MYSNVPPPTEHAEDSSFETKKCVEVETSCSNSEDRNLESSEEKLVNAAKNARRQRFQLLKERREKLSNQQESTKRKRRKNPARNDSSSEASKRTTSGTFTENKMAWKELCQNIDVNAHLSQGPIAKEKTKSKLEEKLDDAIEKRDFVEAESISDEIAKQDLAVKIVGAVEVRDYKKWKDEEEQFEKTRKKKKLTWGFEQKQRWESKGNM